MKYPAPDGHIIESSPLQSVTYSCYVPIDLPNGTFVSYETTSKSDNSLQQIKVVRIIEDNLVHITVTEQTQQEIEQYFQNINQ
jgi:hypothetical protein